MQQKDVMSLTYPPCNFPCQDNANRRYSLDLTMENLRVVEHIIRFDRAFKIILTLHTSHWWVNILNLNLGGGIKMITFLVTHRGCKPAMHKTSDLKHPLGYRFKKM